MYVFLKRPLDEVMEATSKRVALNRCCLMLCHGLRRWPHIETLQCMVNAACSESRRLRVRTPLWHFSFEDTKCFFPAHSNRFNIVGSLRHGSNFESFVWRAVSSHSSHHPEEALLAQFSLYAHKGGLSAIHSILSHHCQHPNSNGSTGTFL